MNWLKVSVIIVAAGAGRRFGYSRNKLFYPLCGRTVLEHTLRHVFAAPCVDEVVLVTAREERSDVERLAAPLAGSCPVVYADGGAERQESVYAGLCACSNDTEVVMVHDGARPWAGPEWFDRGLAAMAEADAAIYGIPLKDTVKERAGSAGEGAAPLRTLERSRLTAVQTPQIFRRDLLVQAYEQARQEHLMGTDDASLVEALGVPVLILPGDERNRKVTTKEDIPILELYMGYTALPHAGFGYDVHALTEGRRLILGGEEIPFEKGLEGHSDADVLVHALMDALLGAAGLRDIGTYFPDTDKSFKDISSMVLLDKVRQLLEERQCRIINVDVTLLAQRPKVKPYVPAMTAHIAQVLHISESAVAVKATTTEHLGFTGREEGMAAQAVAMVLVPSDLKV